MSIKSVGSRINNQNYNTIAKKNNVSNPYQQGQQVSFQGAPSAAKAAFKSPNFVVSLMEFIAAGGYAASFIIQDGLGFITPRVGKGLFRGGKEKKDENGNVILDKNGKPKHELNWAYARKEGLREIITGPSAFVIPWLALMGINKFGTANSVKLNYIDGFKNEFTKYAQENAQQIANGQLDKKQFYEGIFKNVIENTINSDENAIKMTEEEIESTAREFAKKQIKYDEVLKDKSISRWEFKRKNKANELYSIAPDFMELKKRHIGGNTNEMLALFNTSDGKIGGGAIKELSHALHNYYDDAANTVKKALNSADNVDISEVIKGFTHRRMGSRIMTNIGLFLAVAAFYTQIPKLYNMGLKGNPALGEQNDTPALQNSKKDVNFTGNYAKYVEGAGKRVYNNKVTKYISDIFELDGPIIQGGAMSVLLYGFCIPPRLINAQDKYDHQEIVVRDMTAFTTLLFGAKALGRLFSDGFTKITGLALNEKHLEGRNLLQKITDYLNPSDGNHSVLSSEQLNSKYTFLERYKNGVNGFVEFIEKSGGDIKKAFSMDKDAKKFFEKVLNKSYSSINSDEIKDYLKTAYRNNSKELENLYKIFRKENGLLNSAKTCNSTFGFISTILLVPGLIIALTDYCKRMTDRHKAKDDAEKLANLNQTLQAPVIPSSKPTMAGFLNK